MHERLACPRPGDARASPRGEALEPAFRVRQRDGHEHVGARAVAGNGVAAPDDERVPVDLGSDSALRGVERLVGIEEAVVGGDDDLACDALTAYELHQAEDLLDRIAAGGEHLALGRGFVAHRVDGIVVDVDDLRVLDEVLA